MSHHHHHHGSGCGGCLLAIFFLMLLGAAVSDWRVGLVVLGMMVGVPLLYGLTKHREKGEEASTTDSSAQPQPVTRLVTITINIDPGGGDGGGADDGGDDADLPLPPLPNTERPSPLPGDYARPNGSDGRLV